MRHWFPMIGTRHSSWKDHSLKHSSHRHGDFLPLFQLFSRTDWVLQVWMMPLPKCSEVLLLLLMMMMTTVSDKDYPWHSNSSRLAHSHNWKRSSSCLSYTKPIKFFLLLNWHQLAKQQWAATWWERKRVSLVSCSPFHLMNFCALFRDLWLRWRTVIHQLCLAPLAASLPRLAAPSTGKPKHAHLSCGGAPVVDLIRKHKWQLITLVAKRK